MPASSRTPFHVLMVLDQDFPPDPRVENEALSLVEAGFEVTVLAIAPDERPAEEYYQGIRIIRDRLPKNMRNKMRGLAGTLPLYTWYLSWRIREVYKRYPFHALHTHDLYLFGGGLKAGKALGVSVVGDLHENWVEALKHYAWSTRFPGNLVVSIPRWERVEKKWVHAVDKLVVVIEEAAERNQALGVPDERITTVPNTIKRDAFDAYEEDAALIQRLRSPLTITYTGGMDIHRGLESVIRAMPGVLEQKPEARLVLVGDGRIKPELEELTRSLGLEEQIWFEGWQAQALLKSYILGSDICLVPHLKTVHTDATIPHKLFHYMYYEKPVVVSNCRPLKRIVEAEKAGLVYEAGNAEALAQAILKLAETPTERVEMGRRGRAAVLERYNWDATVQGLIGVYQQLAKQ